MGEGLDGVEGSLLAIGFDDRQAERGDPPNRVASLADHACALPEPPLDLVSPREQVADGSQCQFGQVNACCIVLILGHEVLVLQLLIDLFPGSDEGHSVDTGHHCLFDGLPFDVAQQFPGHGVVLSGLALQVLFDHPVHHLRHVGVDVTGFLGWA